MALTMAPARLFMTEAEWLISGDPDRMLQHLRGRSSDRKLRLFACACCRHIWDTLPDERCRQAVEVIERCADGLESTQKLEVALAEAEALEATASGPARAAARAVVSTWSTVEHARSAAAQPADDPEAERSIQASLNREVFGNPFRPAAIDPAWLTWNAGSVPKLAQSIYNDRAFDCIPALAQMLEDAGCTSAQILGHCRRPGTHVRGCWVVDALLGKG
jgi:hypothetical protein